LSTYAAALWGKEGGDDADHPDAMDRSGRGTFGLYAGERGSGASKPSRCRCQRSADPRVLAKLREQLFVGEAMLTVFRFGSQRAE
jgi:hypothetical protein